MAFVPLSTQPVYKNGVIVPGALLYAYDTGTTNPRPIYLDKGQSPTRVYTTPVVATDGTWPLMWVGVGDYDLKITDPFGSQIKYITGLPGDAAAAPTSTYDPLRQIATGALIRFYGTGRLNGYVRANGQTLGSGVSGATERANDDTQALFLFLYAADPNLAVAGGRSPLGALADFQAGKTLTLPNYVDAFQVGVGNLYTLGQTGGEATHTLSLGEIPSHGHSASVTINAAGGFTPSGSLTTVPDHTHNIVYQTQNVYGSGSNGAAITVGTTPNNQTGTSQAAGGHSHTFTGNAQPDHTHTGSVTVNSAGSGGPHNNLPPYIGDTAYLKL